MIETEAIPGKLQGNSNNDRELLIGIIIGISILVLILTITAVYFWLKADR